MPQTLPRFSYWVAPALALSLSICITPWGLITAAETTISFNRDIRPILSNHCFACHGPDAESVAADLRLDLESEATVYAIVPGSADDSEVMLRILSDDPDAVMPPPELHKPLDAAQKTLIRRWINEGAQYEPHWAYTSLKRPESNIAKQSEPTGLIDHFIDLRLRSEEMKPADKADPVTLIRRLSFDLTGLPPTPSDVHAFKNDSSREAYRKLIDRLLDSPRYGERMAVYWLDLVRYADTVGYHGDQDVSISPYRDYVIDSFNANLPYDDFVREQLAGDLFPDATKRQRIATGYNRLNQTTEEGGAQPKEYLAIYFADRVRNVSQVFMGATVGCAQCHDHKYDPYTMKDFYALGAFFADIQEQGKYGARSRPPEMPVPTAQQERDLSEFDAKISEATEQLVSLREELSGEQSSWELALVEQLKDAKPVESIWVEDEQNTGGSISGNWDFVSADKHPVHRGERSRRQSSNGLVQHYFINAKKTVPVTENTLFFSWIYLDENQPPQAVMLQFNAGDDRGGWSHRAVWGKDAISYGKRNESWAGYYRMGQLPESGQWVRLSVEAKSLGLKPGDVVHGVAFTQFAGTAHWDQLGWVDTGSTAPAIAEALPLPPSERTQEQKDALNTEFLKQSPEYAKQLKAIDKLKSQRQKLADSVTTTMITKSVSPRTIRILPRGNWMDDSGEIVEPAIPEFLGTLSTNSRATRLDLANWLSRDDNVLTSRTMVNRLWYLMFGRGLASSVDDLGGQGTYPSHPELLDYLSGEFVDSGWDIKHILRLIASSEAYQRSSTPTPQQIGTDPYNELIARQGRFRISAEMVRDTALLTSGLLVENSGGISAKPYQPEGYYAQLNFPRRVYSADQDESQYRRGVYTHWQRTFLHPMLKAFDAPNREECTARRPRSNTPLQALTLLNDPTFVEAARVFAQRAIRDSGSLPEARIAFLYKEAVSRDLDDLIAAELNELYQEHFHFYSKNLDQAAELVSVGLAAVPESVDVAELAAMTSVARVILNLQETITRY